MIKMHQRSRTALFLSFFFLALTFAFALAGEGGEATFTLYYSNDLIGYLTPCG
jgi:hypothetical protein